MTKDEIAAQIHGEVVKYVDREFNDREDFLSELGLISDDLSAIALALERRFQVKIDRRRYRKVSNVEDYSVLMNSALQSDGGKAR